MKTFHSPYESGYDAGYNGGSFGNPYEKGTREYEDWEMGFSDGDNEYYLDYIEPFESWYDSFGEYNHY